MEQILLRDSQKQSQEALKEVESTHIMCLSSQGCYEVAKPVAKFSSRPRQTSWSNCCMDTHRLQFLLCTSCLSYLHTGRNQALLTQPAILHLHGRITFMFLFFFCVCGFVFINLCLILFSAQPRLGGFLNLYLLDYNPLAQINAFHCSLQPKLF